MARNRPYPLKRRLGRAARLSKRAPVWVMVKTRGRIRSSAKRRQWRRGSIKP
ncbi:MAG: hypothetical protein QW567_02230 [Candidatus Hadarchaeales archaeon]